MNPLESHSTPHPLFPPHSHYRAPPMHIPGEICSCGVVCPVHLLSVHSLAAEARDRAEARARSTPSGTTANTTTVVDDDDLAVGDERAVDEHALDDVLDEHHLRAGLERQVLRHDLVLERALDALVVDRPPVVVPPREVQRLVVPVRPGELREAGAVRALDLVPRRVPARVSGRPLDRHGRGRGREDSQLRQPRRGDGREEGGKGGREGRARGD